MLECDATHALDDDCDQGARIYHEKRQGRCCVREHKPPHDLDTEHIVVRVKGRDHNSDHKRGRGGGVYLRVGVADAGSMREELCIMWYEERFNSSESGEAFVIVNFIVLKGFEPGAAERVSLKGFPEEGAS